MSDKAWCFEVNEFPQAACWGEHILAAVQSPESVSNVLKPLVALYAMKIIETNLGWYLSEGMLSPDLGKAVPDHIR